MAPQIWLVTGASNGIGLATTEFLLANGDAVVAAVRKPESMKDYVAKYGADKCHVVKLNVQSKEDIDAAFASAKDKFGRVDVVYNNAGYSAVGEIEAIPLEDARDMFETNFWGATNISLAAIKFFREVNKPAGGRLIQASSIYGICPAPVTGFYGASKYALEGVTESIAAELDPAWNIKVTLAELGFYRTNFVKNHTYKVYDHPAYTNPQLIGNITRSVLAKVDPTAIKGDPDKLAKRLYDLANLEDPPLHILLGQEGAMLQPHLDKCAAERKKYASWMDGLSFDE